MNEKSALPAIGITMGDAAGVGPEIIMKSLAHADLRRRRLPVPRPGRRVGHGRPN
jgi:hypothetical protein